MKAKLNRQASRPVNTSVVSNLAGIVCAGCTVAVLVFGAPLMVLLGGIAIGGGGAALAVRHHRRLHAWRSGTRKAAPLWRPGGRTYLPGQHKPTCRAKSAATCRCHGRRHLVARRKPTPKRRAPAKRRSTKR